MGQHKLSGGKISTINMNRYSNYTHLRTNGSIQVVFLSQMGPIKMCSKQRTDQIRTAHWIGNFPTSNYNAYNLLISLFKDCNYHCYNIVSVTIIATLMISNKKY